MGRCRRELAKMLALVLVAICLFQTGMAAHASVRTGIRLQIYRVIERGNTVDLTEVDMGDQEARFIMTLCVGTGNQLDYGAVQYIVTVTIAPETITAIKDSLTFELTRNSGGSTGTSKIDNPPPRIYGVFSVREGGHTGDGCCILCRG